MLKILLSCALLIIISTSCATLVNNRTTRLYLQTTSPVTIVQDNDTLRFGSDELATFYVDRSNKPFVISVANDSLSKKMVYNPKLSTMYYLNILYPPLWPGLLIDLKSNKRFDYTRYTYLDDRLEPQKLSHKSKKQLKLGKLTAESFHLNQADETTYRGDWIFDLPIPFVYIGHTATKPAFSGRNNKMSVLGLAAGLSYYYKDNRFLNLTGSISAAGDITVGGQSEGWDDEDRINTYSLTLSNNHRQRKTSFGYGLAYNYYSWWNYTYLGNDEHAQLPYYTYNRSHKYSKMSSLGFVLNGYYYFTDSFAVGLIYKPTFVRLKPNDESRFAYEHQITLDFAFKIRLNKRNK